MTPEQLVLFGTPVGEHEAERRARLELRRGIAAREAEVKRWPRREQLHRPAGAVDEAALAAQHELARRPRRHRGPGARLLALGKPGKKIADMTDAELDAFAEGFIAAMTRPRPAAPSS